MNNTGLWTLIDCAENNVLDLLLSNTWQKLFHVYIDFAIHLSIKWSGC